MRESRKWFRFAVVAVGVALAAPACNSPTDPTIDQEEEKDDEEPKEGIRTSALFLITGSGLTV